MAEPTQGSVVAGCRLEEEIGRGGMGVVYRATDESLQRTVAVKIIAPELTTNPDFRERFKRESRLAASIEHANVVPVYAAGETEELLYLVTRYIRGTDLRALIQKDGALEPARAARIVAQVAAALGAAHRRDLIHRDVKPANVLIERDASTEHAYLTDFGIARDVGGGTALTRTGMLVGTMDYIAPERLEDRPGDGRSDIYALGCVLFETLTGQVPFPRDSDVAKMYAHMNEPVPSPREFRSDVPERLAEATTTAMAKDPDDRFTTAEDLAETLRAEASTLSGPRPTPAPGPTAPAAAAPLPPTEHAAPPQTPLPPTQHRPPATPPPATPPPARPPAGLRPASPPPAQPPPASPSTPTTRQLPGRRRVAPLAIAGVALLAAAVAGVLVLAGGSDDDSGGGEKKTSSKTSSSEPLSPKALSPIKLSAGVDGINVGAGLVWVVNKQKNTLTRIDPDTRKPAGTTPVGKNPDSVAVGEGSVWVTNTDDDNVSRVSTSGKVEDTIKVGDGPEGILAGRGAVWVANGLDGSVTRIDAGGGAPRTVPVGTDPVQLAFDQDSVWVTNSGDGTIQSLDQKTGEPIDEALEVGNQPRGIAFSDDGLLYVSLSDDDLVVAVDPASRKVVKRISVPGNPREVRAGEGGIWVTCADGGSVVVIDTKKRDVAGEASVTGNPFGLGVGEGKAWAGSIAAGIVTPVKPN